jgi:hypothetical protein
VTPATNPTTEPADKPGLNDRGGCTMPTDLEQHGGEVELDERFAIDPSLFGDADGDDLDEADPLGPPVHDGTAPFIDSTDFPWLDLMPASEGGGR